MLACRISRSSDKVIFVVLDRMIVECLLKLEEYCIMYRYNIYYMVDKKLEFGGSVGGRVDLSPAGDLFIEPVAEAIPEDELRLGSRVDQVLSRKIDVSESRRVVEERLMFSNKRIFAAPEEVEGNGLVFYYHSSHMKPEFVIRDLEKWLLGEGHVIDQRDEDGIYQVTLSMGEQVTLKPEPISEEVRALERRFSQAETDRWQAQNDTSSFMGMHEDFSEEYPEVDEAEPDELVGKEASDFDILDPEDVALFDEYVGFAREKVSQVQLKEALKQEIVIQEISPKLKEAQSISSSEELHVFVEQFNEVHPEGFAEDRFSIVKELHEEVLAFNKEGKLQVFPSRTEFDQECQADSSLRQIYRFPQVVESEESVERNVTDEAVLAAAEDLFRVFETALGVKKPVHLIYGLGKDCGASVSSRFLVRFQDARGKFLGNINWTFGDEGAEFMGAGQFEISYQTPLRGRGGGRALVKFKEEMGRFLGYRSMEIRVENNDFWARIFREGTDLTQKEACRAIGRAKYHGEASVFPDWEWHAKLGNFRREL